VSAVDPCTAAEECVQPYLDRALSADERVAVERHLERCAYCRKRYEFEVALRLVVRRCSCENPPPGLVERLRSRCCDHDA
jgi:anti-sigma factor (TIGR02949 family)